MSDKFRDFARANVEAIIQSANVGILVSDPTLPDNPTVFVNPVFLRITGYTSKEVLERNCRFLQEGATDPEVLAKLRAAMKEGRSFRGLLKNRRKDGTLFWNELVVDPVFNKSGTLVNSSGRPSLRTSRYGLHPNSQPTHGLCPPLPQGED